MSTIPQFKSEFLDSMPKGESCQKCHNDKIRKVLFSSDVQSTGRYGCYECSHCETEIKEIYDPILLMQLGMRSRAVSSLFTRHEKKFTNQEELNFLLEYGTAFNPTLEEKIKVNTILQKTIYEGINLFDTHTKIPASNG